MTSTRLIQDLEAYLTLGEELRKQEELLLAEHRSLFDQMMRNDYAAKVSSVLVFQG